MPEKTIESDCRTQTIRPSRPTTADLFDYTMVRLPSAISYARGLIALTPRYG